MEIWRNGKKWKGDDDYVFLPQDWKIGGLYKRMTAWGSNPRHPVWPSGAWLSGEELRAGAYRDKFTVRGVPLPAKRVVIVDEGKTWTFEFASGFALGALLDWGGLRNVYLVLYRDGDGWRCKEAPAPKREPPPNFDPDA